MTAYNVVRFRVKPGMEEQFVASQREDLKRKMPGAIEAALIKTGERTYCFVGKWDTFDSIVAARPTMIGMIGNGSSPSPRALRSLPVPPPRKSILRNASFCFSLAWKTAHGSGGARVSL